MRTVVSFAKGERLTRYEASRGTTAFSPQLLRSGELMNDGCRRRYQLVISPAGMDRMAESDEQWPLTDLTAQSVTGRGPESSTTRPKVASLA